MNLVFTLEEEKEFGQVIGVIWYNVEKDELYFRFTGEEPEEAIAILNRFIVFRIAFKRDKE